MTSTDIRLRPALLFFVFGLLIFACSGQQKSENEKSSPTTDSVTVAPAADSLRIELIGLDSLSVFELLEKSHRVSYHPTALGVFVNGIDSVENDARHYWVYSVNDSMPQIASDKYLTATGDRIVWHYRKVE